jgi:hypothetical protein
VAVGRLSAVGLRKSATLSGKRVLSQGEPDRLVDGGSFVAMALLSAG